MTFDDVAHGLVPLLDWKGNAAADELAVAGACNWSDQCGERRQAWLRATTTIAVQKMMLDIITARTRAYSQLQERDEVITISSDEDECSDDSEEQSDEDGDCSDRTSQCSDFSSDLEPD